MGAQEQPPRAEPTPESVWGQSGARARPEAQGFCSVLSSTSLGPPTEAAVSRPVSVPQIQGPPLSHRPDPAQTFPLSEFSRPRNSNLHRNAPPPPTGSPAQGDPKRSSGKPLLFVGGQGHGRGAEIQAGWAGSQEPVPHLSHSAWGPSSHPRPRATGQERARPSVLPG